jgi:uncharacterized membrane protein YphA (DoxX/SURF4 family)
MKIAVIIVRVLMGLLLLFGASVYFLNLFPQPELTGNTKIFMDGVNASKYLMPFIKITEFLCGIAFISGYFVPLAAVVLAPITLNIFLYHAFVAPEGLPVAIFLLLGNLFLGYANWEKYQPMLKVK